MALELRPHDIDLLGADQAAVEALIVRALDEADLSARVDELRELVQLMADHAGTGTDPKQDSTVVAEPEGLRQ
ncbi:hypothetical protein [Ectothiorhodospira sp. PHS-1]|uniref:hypothetical protein n=1 Tax=Ectothiorhodospira sp. PHS-1 TaxID=519989 RepID=UPI001145A71C|nr:hypothetical protein [Ectothiorhodospira sp. PHS-1]